MKKILSGWWMRGLAGVREFGPYAAVELLLPGRIGRRRVAVAVPAA
jgi:hypothetical protein